MIVQTLQEAEIAVKTRWEQMNSNKRAEIEERYTNMRRNRKQYKKNLKPIIDQMCATHNV